MRKINAKDTKTHTLREQEENNCKYDFQIKNTADIYVVSLLLCLLYTDSNKSI